MSLTVHHNLSPQPRPDPQRSDGSATRADGSATSEPTAPDALAATPPTTGPASESVHSAPDREEQRGGAAAGGAAPATPDATVPFADGAAAAQFAQAALAELAQLQAAVVRDTLAHHAEPRHVLTLLRS